MSEPVVNQEPELNIDVEVVEASAEPQAAQCSNCSKAECKGCEPEASASVELAVEAAVEAAVEPTVEAVPQAAVQFDIQAAINAQVAEAVAKVKLEAEASISQAKAEVEQANAKLNAEIEAKQLRETQAECRAKFQFVPCDFDDLGSAIKALRKSDSEACAKLEAALSSANALLSDPIKSQTAPIGSVSETSISTDAKINQLAQAKLDAKIVSTIEQARVLVYTEQPELLRATRGTEE